MSETRVSDEANRAEALGEISVGRELRRAREVRGVSLAQLSAETRIAARHLEALEADRFDELPGPLYARNFLRAAARALGVDEQSLVEDFDYQNGRAPSVAAAALGRQRLAARRRFAFLALAAAAALIVAVLGFSLLAGQDEGVSVESPSVADSSALPASAEAEGGAARASRPPRPEAAPVLSEAAAASTAAGSPPQVEAPRGGAPPTSTGRTAPTPAAAAVASPAVVERVSAPAESVTLAEAEPAPAASEPRSAAVPAPTGFTSSAAVPRVRLAFRGPSWIEIVPEGEGERIMGLKTAGQEVTFALSGPVEVQVANAGNVELWVAGLPARPLGAAGERRTLRLDPRNWRSYLK